MTIFKESDWCNQEGTKGERINPRSYEHLRSTFGAGYN